MTCSIDGCKKPALTRGYCSGHYHRLIRYGDAIFVPPPRPVSKCSLSGCDGDVAGAGFCRKHYARFRAHGHPLGGSTSWGAARKFVENAAASDAEECIIFPYSRDANGYGHLNVDSGRYVGAHAFAAELRHGKKPTPKHESCHTCGNGAGGCVNGSHLYWGTRSDNVLDAIAHGTAYAATRPVGEDSPNSKFSNATIAAARERMSAGEPALRVARDLGISNQYIYYIRDFRSRRADNKHHDAANDNTPTAEEKAA